MQFFTALVSSISNKEQFLINYHIQFRRLSILFLISVTLVSFSSFYLLPVAYSQELSSYTSYIVTQIGELSWPSDIALDQEGNVYVADTDNHRIQVFSSNGTFISGWGKYGGIANGTLISPEGIAVDSSSGNVYVADTDNHRIQVFSSNGTFISGWGKYGGIAHGTLRFPEGIAVDSSSGNVYVADTDNSRIQVFSNNGTFISGWGKYDPRALNGSFSNPADIALDQEGNVYVADTAHNRIQVFSSNGTFISGWGKYGIANGTLKYPEGIAIDPSSGNVY